MASSARRESIRGAVLDILHCGADPAPRWRAPLGGGNPVGLARDVECCVQCGERAEWNEDARSDHLLRDVLHARFACRRQTGDGQRPSAWPLIGASKRTSGSTAPATPLAMGTSRRSRSGNGRAGGPAPQLHLCSEESVSYVQSEPILNCASVISVQLDTQDNVARRRRGKFWPREGVRAHRSHGNTEIRKYKALVGPLARKYGNTEIQASDSGGNTEGRKYRKYSTGSRAEPSM